MTEESGGPAVKRGKSLHAIPDLLWAPLAGGLLMPPPGLLGLAAGNLWLFPSLGPTAFLQVTAPLQANARFYNTLVGHLIGVAAAVGAVLLLGADGEPSVFVQKELFPLRVWASALAVALTLLFQLLLRAEHPPAAATTLLISLGGFGPGKDLAFLLVGVLIIAFTGELLRRARVR